MPNQTLTFTTFNCGTKYIQVDQDYVNIETDEGIDFLNALSQPPQPIPGVPLEIEFFNAETKATVAASSICDQWSGAKLLIDPGTPTKPGSYTCKVKMDPSEKQVIAYKARTPVGTNSPGYHEPLDPVIIIKPPYNVFSSSDGVLPVFMGGLIVGAALVWIAGLLLRE